jgi:hypothetical protein
MILTCDSDAPCGRMSERVVRVERAPSPAALDFAFDFDVDLGTDYPARVSQRDEVRATASCFYIFYFGFCG